MTTSQMPPEMPSEMARCEVTGKLVPADELVEINGQRVCAEGKQILLERLRSGAALPGELERPTVMRRFGCAVLDSIIIGVPMAVLGGVVGALSAAGGPSAIQVAQMVIALISAVVAISYFAIMHAVRGQTLGKMAGKLKVVNMDGSNISATAATVRSLAFKGPALLIVIGYLALPLGVLIPAIMTGIVSLYGLANALVALVDRTKQRAIHDLIAGTRVIFLDQ